MFALNFAYFSFKVSIVWTQEVIVFQNKSFVEKKTQFLAKSSDFELNYNKNKTKLKLKFGKNKISVNRALEWTLTRNPPKNAWILDFDVISDQTIRISGKNGANGTQFAVQWTPNRNFISLKVTNISEETQELPRIASKSAPKAEFGANLEDFLCRKWFHDLIRAIEWEQRLCSAAKDVCDYGATLVARDIVPRLPEECLQCARDHAFGQRKRVDANVTEAEVVFVLGCDLRSRDGQRLVASLRRMANALKREFAGRGVRTHFRSVVAIGDGVYRRFWPKSESELNLRRVPFETRNLSHSLDFLFVTSSPERPLSRHVILVECAVGCAEDALLDFGSARTHLLNQNLFLHVFTENAFKMRSKKARHVIGVDAERAFVSASGAADDVTARALRQSVSASRDLCHVLALETNGTVFRTKSLNSKNSRALIARRVADNHVTNACFDCDCVSARDHMTAAVECRLCAERAATVGLAAKGTPSGGHDVVQEWTEEDDRDDDEETIDDGDDDEAVDE